MAPPPQDAQQPRVRFGEAGCGRLVVKCTFLDVVDDSEPQPDWLGRAYTDSALSALSRKLVDYLPSALTWPPKGSRDGQHSPEMAASDSPGSPPVQQCGDQRTTLMLRNLPNNYTREMLLQLLDGKGFAKSYNFVYLPIDFRRGCGLGYAFINLVDPALVPKFTATFEGHSDWSVPTSKVCHVTWSDPHQGLRANLKRYRNSPVMHSSVPDAYKPCLFADGERVAFPPPCRGLRPPQKRAPAPDRLR